MQEEVNMNKMNEVLKQKWIAALRSGEFKQSRYKLFNLHDKGYCCLGVLAVQQGATLDNGGCLRSSNWHDMKRAGSEYLRDEYAGGLDYLTQHHLSIMNDGNRCNFNEIANWVEVNL